MKVLVAQSCLTLYDPMDCSLPGSFVHGILEAGILEWVAIPFSRGDIPDPGIDPGSPILQADSLPSELPGDLQIKLNKNKEQMELHTYVCTGLHKEMLLKEALRIWRRLRRWRLQAGSLSAGGCEEIPRVRGQGRPGEATSCQRLGPEARRSIPRSGGCAGSGGPRGAIPR